MGTVNLMITHLNFAKGFRGGERQTLLLVEELSKRGYTQILVTRKNSELANRAKDIKNLKILKISKPYIFSLGVIKKSKVLHAHETKAAQFTYFANKLFKIPYIITRRVDNPIKNNFLNKKIYENSSSTVVLSKAIENETLKVAPKTKVEVIPSAYSKFKIDKYVSKKIKERFSDKYLVGNIGELDNVHKGQYYLIEAAKRIENKYPDIHFIFLGKGKDELNYKEQSTGMTNITFEGFVDNVGDYISCLNLFVFPSLNEGLGSILFDVIQQKVPIIASNVGGIPEIIENEKSGILVETKNIELLYKSIEKVYLDKTLGDKLALQAIKDIDKFSPEIMTNKYEKIYDYISL